MMSPLLAPALSALPPHAHMARLADSHRLATLRATGLLDGTANPVLDRLARLTSSLLDVPIALVSLVDDRGQHFPGLSGLTGWAGDQRGTPLSHSFCQHVVAHDRRLIVENAATYPLVMENLAFKELGVVAYAGVPLRTAAGETLGALCAIDTAPVHWTDRQVEIIEDLSAAAMAEIELRATVRALLEAQDRLRQQALQDPLTGLLNRRGFAERARQHLALAQRTAAPFTLVAMDLDRFKQINDQFGHDAGDEALVDMAALLTETARESDVVCRHGGDEFMVLLSSTGANDVEAFRSRLQSALRALNAEPYREYALASSMGAATWTPETPHTLPTMLHLADEALYADKACRRQSAGAT